MMPMNKFDPKCVGQDPILLSPHPGRMEATIRLKNDGSRGRSSPELLKVPGKILELLHFARHADRWTRQKSSMLSYSGASQSSKTPPRETTNTTGTDATRR